MAQTEQEPVDPCHEAFDRVKEATRHLRALHARPDSERDQNEVDEALRELNEASTGLVDCWNQTSR